MTRNKTKRNGMKETFKQTPNISARKIEPEGIILHHTAGSYDGSVSWCLNPDSKVSYHCIVDKNGDRTILAKDCQRAWHAGKSSYKGRKDCNSYMLGISVSGDTNKRELTDEETKSVAKWCIEKMVKHSISINKITTHAVVSPGRKFDVSDRAYQTIMDEIREQLNLNC